VGGKEGVQVGGDGACVSNASGALVAGLVLNVRMTIEIVRKVKQIVLHMLVRWKPRINWEVKEMIAMVKQKSEIELETVNANKGGSR